MSKSSAESIPTNTLWEIIRYALVAIAGGLFIWYYWFYTPLTFSSQEYTGQTAGTPYIVNIPQFPDNADWTKLTEEIQNRLDALAPPDPATLKKAIPVWSTDISATEGYAVDCIAELLEEQKITDYLIEVGNCVRCKGKKSKDADWNIGIEKPPLEASKEFPGLQQNVVLRDQSLATKSGSLPVNAALELRSVAVVADDCFCADAWATAMFLLGESGIESANQHGIAVLVLYRRGENVEETFSKHWRK